MAKRTTTERGYGSAHQTEKRRLNPIIFEDGAWCCAVECLMPTRLIPPGTRSWEWHLGHDRARTRWTGPEHPKCNVTDGARRAHIKAIERSKIRWRL